MILLLLAVSLLTGVVSFGCSLTEAVLLSLNPLSLRLSSTRGDADAARWMALKQRVERPISALLLFNTLANTGLATLAGAIFSARFGSQWLWAFTLALSALVIFGGELAPKVLGVHHAERLAPRLAGPLAALVRLTHPAVALMERFCRLLRPAGPAATPAAGDRIMDIVTLVEAARAEQAIHSREEIIIIHAATLSARRVRSAMVPREAVKCFDARKSLLENVDALGPRLHRSYPVSADGSPDRITGYVRVRELFVRHLAGGNEPPDWRPLTRPVLRIDEKASLTQLLALFLDHDEIAALVDSADGSVAGWITMDDVTHVLMGQRV